MLARLGGIAWLALVAAQGAGEAPRAPELVAPPVRQRLRTLASDVARTGDLELVERMRAVLAGLGDGAAQLERLERDANRIALNAKPGRSTRAAVAGKLRRELAPLVEQLAREDEPRKSALARWILALDLEQPEANAVLGRVREEDGTWLTAEERTWLRGAQRSERLRLAAGGLEMEIEHGASTNPALLALGGGGNCVRAAGVELHARLSPQKLERILRQSLRAAALSRAVLLGTLDLPPVRPRAFVLLETDELQDAARAEALAAGGLTRQEHDEAVQLGLHSFVDGRGWRTSGWRSEGGFEALILWELLGDWLGPDAQPCLRVGHLNWVCLSFLGAPMPTPVWSEEVAGTTPAQRSSTQLEDSVRRALRWRCARGSLWGTRAWMIDLVRGNHAPSWARAMQDQDGKIRDTDLLGTTLVCEFLQQEGRMWELVEATRQESAPLAAIERTLGEALPEFEQRWRRWLDPPVRSGVLQLLEQAPTPAGTEGSPFAAALLALNQARADALAGQQPEIPIVELDPELARAAASHARYLTLNPEQKTAWPAVHEEYAGEPGFTPAGALAGARAVIAFDGDPLESVQAWLATFYHRLPLLDPGLFGAGFGQSEEVVVLDVHSLVVEPWKDHVVVWPLSGAVGVPRSGVSEVPSPVPGADLATLGYPISVQLHFARPEHEPELELALFVGEGVGGARVEAHLVTPATPPSIARAPRNAWGLIPKAPLAKKTRYTARAEWSGRVQTWSFTTGE